MTLSEYVQQNQKTWLCMMPANVYVRQVKVQSVSKVIGHGVTDLTILFPGNRYCANRTKSICWG